NVSVLLGNGDGTFQAARYFTGGSFPLSVAVGDFNGDGLADLAVANNGSGNVSVLLGNGDGTFQATRNFGAGSGPRSVAVGDFNGDGAQDLAVTNSGSNNVSVLINNTPIQKQKAKAKR
ncbi:MAG: FG-GAP repeat domain-containing protein, partial [Pseudomonas sp.]